MPSLTVISSLLVCLFVTSTKAEDIPRLIGDLHSHPWSGRQIVSIPMSRNFNFTDPMKALLEIGPAAQKPLLASLSDTSILDRVIILLGGVGDERSIGPIIKAIQRTAPVLPPDKAKKLREAGNIALTNITVADSHLASRRGHHLQSVS